MYPSNSLLEPYIGISVNIKINSDNFPFLQLYPRQQQVYFVPTNSTEVMEGRVSTNWEKAEKGREKTPL